ncbi:GTPase [endosymbiont GvMRE of Glomus versiforme]|uniref:GTPase n=1 Tax=endosymbiont GvMRE of Glomus versiforme TaxID=2039283 RepID=UPI000EF03BC9|nr:GTPase [endosymbiont GvMRE of Glomus versiforme]RHZ36910.1 GTPase IMAP family member 4-like [endosymbiont GvMRE of Glomus versiforme]
MNIKNILLIGRTGGGKSTLANTLINQNNNFEEVFKESAGSVSETKNVQIKEFIVNLTEDGSEKVRYLVIDTAGFGDTKLTDKEVLQLMSEMVKIIGDDGLIQIFFVTNSRFTKEEVDVYQLLESVIFDNQVSKYTTIVKTKFPEFENEAKCEEDRQKFQAENPELARIFNVNKIIYVNNPPLVGRPAVVELNKEIREESRKRLLANLGKYQSIYQPGNLSTLNQRINSYKTQKENWQNQINNLNSQISSAQSNYWSQVNSLESRHQQEMQALEQRRQNELNQIREKSRYGYIDNRREYWNIMYTWNKDASILSAINPVCMDDWITLRSDFDSSLQGLDIPFRYYSYPEASNKLVSVLINLARNAWHIDIMNNRFFFYGVPRAEKKSLEWRYRDSESKIKDFFNYNLEKSDVESGLHIWVYKNSDYNADTKFRIGTKYHSKIEDVNLEKALREASEAQEYEINSQIERIKQENRDRENRLWQEVENQRRLNGQRITQERQNIQANLDSVRQNSQARISYAQQQINDAERNLEQQIQQQTNLPSIASLAGMIAKMFIGN